MYNTILLDVDGTILDSQKILLSAFKSTLRNYWFR
jgi:phosphoglycolate phosphatase-like HAD superfamily hydrolase